MPVLPLVYMQGTRLLRLKIIAGHNLAKKDIFGASDPYVKIDVIRDEDEAVIDSVFTKTMKRTLNPKWNEEFIFRVKPGIHHLSIEVFDENRLTRDDFLGVVELPLQNIPRERADRTISHKNYILRPRTSKSKVRGHLQIYHAYLPSESEDESPPESEVCFALLSLQPFTRSLYMTATARMGSSGASGRGAGVVRLSFSPSCRMGGAAGCERQNVLR